MKNKELLDKWDNMKPHERNNLIFYDVLDRMPLNTAPNEFGGFGTIPRYSEDISAAWEVLEFPEIIHKVQLGVYPTSFGQWVCRSYMPGYEIRVQAKTAPEAICKAALLAVLGEGEA